MRNDKGYLTATVTPEMEIMMKETLNLEIEMLQGVRNVLADGMIEYKLEIDDRQKQEFVKEFILKCISLSHIKNMN